MCGRLSSERQVAGTRQKLLDEFKRLKALPGGKSLSNSLQKLPLFQQIGKLSTLVKVPGLHEALVTPDLIDCVSRLVGRPVCHPRHATAAIAAQSRRLDAPRLELACRHRDRSAGSAAGNPGLFDRRRGAQWRRDLGTGRIASCQHAGVGCGLSSPGSSKDAR